MKFPHFLPLLNFSLGPHLPNFTLATSVGEAGLRVDQLSCMCSIHKGRVERYLVQTKMQLSLGAGDS